MAKEKLPIKNRIWNFLKKWLMVFLNPRMLLCFGIGWMITNGWSYCFVALGVWFDIPWMAIAGGAYLSFLWIPFTPEKIITIIIAIFLMKKLFPSDEKTIGTLKKELASLKAAFKKQKENRALKKQERQKAKSSKLADAKINTEINSTKASAKR